MNCGLKLAKLNVEKSHAALQCQLHASNASQQNNPVKIEWQRAALITQLSHLIMNFTRRWNDEKLIDFWWEFPQQKKPLPGEPIIVRWTVITRWRHVARTFESLRNTDVRCNWPFNGPKTKQIFCGNETFIDKSSSSSSNNGSSFRFRWCFEENFVTQTTLHIWWTIDA